MNKKVSVIIPTYNRNLPLRKALASLFVQDYPDFEIIVVDQSTKKFAGKIAFLKKNQKKLRYFFLKKPSPPAAKNFGWRKARGEIILFCDDDIIAQKSLIGRHADNYENKNYVGVAGRVVSRNQKLEVDCQKVGVISFLGKVTDGFSSQIRQEVNNVLGCNASWRKKALEKVGGFDENFIGNALREETDLAWRIKKNGGQIIFDPQAEVFHARAETGGCRKKEGRLRWYHDFFHNETYFFLKHFVWLWWPFFWLWRWSYFLRCMFGFGREISLKSILIPWQGIIAGVKSYWRQKNENRG